MYNEKIIFSGEKNQIIEQFSKYMDMEDANKIFEYILKKNKLEHISDNKNNNKGRINKILSVRRAPFNYFSNEYNFGYCRISNPLRNKSQTIENRIVGKKGITCYSRSSVLGVSIYHNNNFCYDNRLFIKGFNRKLRRKQNYQYRIEDLENITVTRSGEVYKIELSKFALVMIAIVLQISLYILLNVDIVSTALVLGVPFLEVSKNYDKKICNCLISIVEQNGKLPKYSSLNKSKCKNLILKCSQCESGKCKINKDMFTKTVNYLLKKGIFKVEEKLYNII